MGNESSQIVKEDDQENNHTLKIEVNSDEQPFSPQSASQDGTISSSTRRDRSQRDAEGVLRAKKTKKKKSKTKAHAPSSLERSEETEVDFQQSERHAAADKHDEEDQGDNVSRDEGALAPRNATLQGNDNGSSQVVHVNENRDVATESKHNLLVEPSHPNTQTSTAAKAATIIIRSAEKGTMNTPDAAMSHSNLLDASTIGRESSAPEAPNGDEGDEGAEGDINQPLPTPTVSFRQLSKSPGLNDDTHADQIIADSQIDTSKHAAKPTLYEESGITSKKRKAMKGLCDGAREKQPKKPRITHTAMHSLEEESAISDEARIPESPEQQDASHDGTERYVTADVPAFQEIPAYGSQPSGSNRADSPRRVIGSNTSRLRNMPSATLSTQVAEEHPESHLPPSGATEVVSNASTGPRRRNRLKPKPPLSVTNIALNDADRGISSADPADDRPGLWTAVNIVRKIQSPLIGVYRNETPLTDVASAVPKKRKRRLPVDDEPEHLPAERNRSSAQQVSEMKDKARKLKHVSRSPTTKSSSQRKEKSSVNGAHKVSSTPRRVPNKGDLDMGRFTDEEIDTISMTLLKHREMHDLSEFDQNLIIAGKSSDAGEIWRAIMDALPRRTRDAIVKVCRRRFHNYGVRGKWTDEDDAELKSLTDAYPKQWVKIGELMSRHHEDCRDRWRNYIICGTQQKTNATWTESEEQKLREAVQHCLKQINEIRASAHADNPREELYPKENIEYVDWQYVSGYLDQTRSRLQCMQKWKRMMERENDNVIDDSLDLDHKSWRIAKASRDYRSMRRSDRLAVLQGIRETQAGREGKIPWARVGDPAFQDKWSIMTRKVAWKSLRRRIPGNETMALQNIVDHLITLLSREVAADAPDSGTDQDTATKKKTPISAEHIVEQDDEDAAAVASSLVVNGSRTKQSKAASRTKSQSSVRVSPELAGDDAAMLLERDEDTPPTLNSNHKPPEDTVYAKRPRNHEPKNGKTSSRPSTKAKSKTARNEDSVSSSVPLRRHDDDSVVNESDSSDDADIPARMPRAREGSIEL